MSNVWGIWVAIYAAVVATGAIFLEIRRWVESGPRLYLTVQSNLQTLTSTDGKLLMVFVSNRGFSPTTITNLGLKRYNNWWQRLRNNPSEDMFVTSPIIEGSGVGRIPYELIPGSQWIGAMNQDDQMEKWLNNGRFYVAVYVTHRDRPIVKRLPRLRRSGPRAKLISSQRSGE